MIEQIISRLFSGKVIVNCERQPYLHRWYIIRTECVSLFLHKFVRSDEDRALHDHPWDFLVIPIWRGYIEHSDRVLPEREADWPEGWKRNPDHPSNRRQVRRRVLPLLGTRFRRGEYRHRVELLKDRLGEDQPSWSLFFKFRSRRTWGFWPKEGFVAWNKWWQEKCE